jgi:hypothetical protein
MLGIGVIPEIGVDGVELIHNELTLKSSRDSGSKEAMTRSNRNLDMQWSACLKRLSRPPSSICVVGIGWVLDS